MSPLLGIFAAPAASTAFDLAGKVIEGAAEPFAAALEAATRCFDEPAEGGALELLGDADGSSGESGAPAGLEELFAAIGL